METIKNKKYEVERSLYGIKNTIVEDCIFDGKTDGESPLKECKNIHVKNTKFNLRYPLWHMDKGILEKVEFTENSRAPFWYSKDVLIKNSLINGIKFLRECKNIEISDSTLNTLEVAWESNNLVFNNCEITSQYPFLESNNVSLNNCKVNGKYSFQYMNNLCIKDSILETKDAFWHSKNVYVYNSTIKGEYLAWFSKNVTLVNCKIIGTQPFCYSKNIKLVNCEMIDCDLAFENTSFKGNVISSIDSIKNPWKCNFKCLNVKEMIIDDYKWKGKTKIIETNTK